MKKIYLFLALAIAVAINANATYYLNTWENGKSELHNACNNSGNWAFSEDGTYTFSTPLTITAVEGFTIKTGEGAEYLTTAITPSNSWKNVKIKDNSNKNNYKNHFKLVPGTYTKVTFDGSTLTFEGTPSESYSFSIGTWMGSGVVIGNLPNSNFTRNSDNTHVLVFKSPITVENEEQFKLVYNDVWYGQWNDNATNEWNWIGSGDGSIDPKNIKLAPGTYYSATIDECTTEGVKMKFNTYAETTKGLDALLSKAADYVEIATDIYVQEHHENHYLAYTTESSTYVAPRAEQDTKYYGDAPEKFAKRDWVKIYAPVEDEFVGKNIAAGTIIEVATGKAVKWGTVGSAAPAFTTNLYRPLNFSATETEKDVMYIFQPQEGEVLQVRGKYAKEGNQEYLTDESGTHKVGLLGFTSTKMTVDQWYTLDGHVCDGVVCYNKVETATGVESVETANATVFAANGTINVSSEAQAAIEVYTANGQMVRAINADNASIAVAPGFYLVKVGNQVSKVVVK